MFTQTTVHQAPLHKSFERGPQLPASKPSYLPKNPIELMGAAMPFKSGEEIYGEKEQAEYFYKVLDGCVRTYKMLNDGRRQIGAFYFAGDTFGLEAGDEHTASAEAIGDCKVLVIKRSPVVALAARNSDVARHLWTLTASELSRAQEHMMLLIKTAQERVAGFLLDMARRLSGNDEIDLPMSRQDIADYLGLTIETVSRTLTQFEQAATISVPTSRRIIVRRRGTLLRLNS